MIVTNHYNVNVCSCIRLLWLYVMFYTNNYCVFKHHTNKQTKINKTVSCTYIFSCPMHASACYSIMHWTCATDFVAGARQLCLSIRCIHGLHHFIIVIVFLFSFFYILVIIDNKQKNMSQFIFHILSSFCTLLQLAYFNWL
jgi:hypothetical protein